ncbi:MAG: DMT family transporter [Clostridia bacterium]|jgi:drug/metabolite transporter (DMT)-like permease
MKLDKGHFTALTTGIVWGTAGFFVRTLFDAGFTPLQVTVYRTVAMALATALIIFCYDRKLFRINKKDLRYIIPMGLFGTALGYLTYNIAMMHTTLAIASMLTYTNPIYTTLLAALIFKERVYRGKVVGLALLIAGCSLLVKVYDAAFFDLNAVGIVNGLMTGLFVSISALCAKRVTRDYHPLTSVFYNFVVGATFLLAFSFPWQPVAGIGPKAAFSLLYLAFIPGVLAFFLYMYSVKRIEVSQTESCVAIEPVMAGIVGFLLFNESFDAMQFAGAAVILMGVLVFNDAWGIERRKFQEKAGGGA